MIDLYRSNILSILIGMAEARSLDMDKIAKGLGGERVGPVSAKGGHFGAMNLAADIAARFKTPQNGGRSTDPKWTERRQLPLRRETLQRLEKLSAQIRERGGGEVHPMQLAALLLEKAAENISDAEALGLVSRGR
jgi:hypothetical protein